MSLEQQNISKDWSVNFAAAFVAWGIPMIIMVYARFLGDFSMSIAWPIALGWLSGTSSINAARCGRVHCLFMSPFFFVMMIFAILFGLGILETNAYTWDILGAVTALGAASIFFGSEAIFGRYVNWHRRSDT